MNSLGMGFVFGVTDAKFNLPAMIGFMRLAATGTQNSGCSEFRSTLLHLPSLLKIPKNIK